MKTAAWMSKCLAIAVFLYLAIVKFHNGFTMFVCHQRIGILYSFITMFATRGTSCWALNACGTMFLTAQAHRAILTEEGPL